jgi:hypothetical protein
MLVPTFCVDILNVMQDDAGRRQDQAVADTLEHVLGSVGTLTVSSCRGDVPWAAGGYFAESGLFSLGMILETHGTTMANIRSNPRVAVSITTGNPFEPYAQGLTDVEVLSDESAISAVHAALRAKSPEIEPLLNITIETVRLHVKTWKVTDILNGWLPAKVLKASET